MTEPKTKLTEEDINTLQYFHQERGDLTRWAGWEENLPVIRKYYPHLYDAWMRLQSAEKTLDIIVRSLDDE